MAGNATRRVGKAAGLILCAAIVLAAGGLWIRAVQRGAAPERVAPGGVAPARVAPPAAAPAAPSLPAELPAAWRAELQKDLTALAAELERQRAELRSLRVELGARRERGPKPAPPAPERPGPPAATGDFAERIARIEQRIDQLEQQNLQMQDSTHERLFNLEARLDKFESDRSTAQQMVLERLNNLELRSESAERRLEQQGRGR